LALLAEAIEAAPRFALAHLLQAHLLGLATEPDAVSQARAAIGEIRNLALDEREAGHLAALEPMVAGDWTRAAVTFDRLSMRFPRDLIALQVGHQMDFLPCQRPQPARPHRPRAALLVH